MPGGKVVRGHLPAQPLGALEPALLPTSLSVSPYPEMGLTTPQEKLPGCEHGQTVPLGARWGQPPAAFRILIHVVNTHGPLSRLGLLWVDKGGALSPLLAVHVCTHMHAHTQARVRPLPCSPTKCWIFS